MFAKFDLNEFSPYRRLKEIYFSNCFLKNCADFVNMNSRKNSGDNDIFSVFNWRIMKHQGISNVLCSVC